MIQVSKVLLGELALINPSATFSPESNDETVAFLPMSAVDAERSTVIASETRLFSEVQKGYTSFRDGDVLLAKITPCFENGKIAQAKIESRIGFGSTEFHVLRPKAELLDARYLVHFLRRPQLKIDGERKMTGSGGQRRVPKYFLESLEIPLPPLPEQSRIVAILDKADELRTKRRQALAQLDRFAQSIFVEFFGDPKTNTHGWTIRSLKELGTVKTGGTPPSSMEGMFGGNIPFVTPGDLESEQPVRRTLTEAGAEKVGTVRAGTALVCCIGATIGKMGKAERQTSLNQQLNAVEWNHEVNDDYGLAAAAAKTECNT